MKINCLGPNHIVIANNDGSYFFSYDTLIAFRAKNGSVFLDSEKWNCSNTTGKYRNGFLGLNKAETDALIKKGEITLVKLNDMI